MTDLVYIKLSSPAIPVLEQRVHEHNDPSDSVSVRTQASLHQG